MLAVLGVAIVIQVAILVWAIAELRKVNRRIAEGESEVARLRQKG